LRPSKKKLDEFSILQTIKISVEEYIELARKRIEEGY